MKIIVIGGTGLIGTNVVKNPHFGPTRFRTCSTAMPNQAEQDGAANPLPPGG